MTSRIEEQLDDILESLDIEDYPEARSRVEAYLMAIAAKIGAPTPDFEKFLSRVEAWLDSIKGVVQPPTDPIIVEALSIIENGTYTAPEGTAYSPIEVDVAGLVPEGTKEITDTNLTDVTEFEFAQVVDENLISGNIKKDVTILGQTGSYEGDQVDLYSGGTEPSDAENGDLWFKAVDPSGTKQITDTLLTDVTNYANAQVVDANLLAENIKKNVSILGVLGSLESGGDSVEKQSGTIIVNSRSNTLIIPITKAYKQNSLISIKLNNGSSIHSPASNGDMYVCYGEICFLNGVYYFDNNLNVAYDETPPFIDAPTPVERHMSGVVKVVANIGTGLSISSNTSLTASIDRENKTIELKAVYNNTTYRPYFPADAQYSWEWVYFGDNPSADIVEL